MWWSRGKKPSSSSTTTTPTTTTCTVSGKGHYHDHQRGRPAPLRVGLVHGGMMMKPKHLHNIIQTDGAWGCDNECVENEKLCFQNDDRFVVQDVFIRALIGTTNTTTTTTTTNHHHHQLISDDLDVLIMPGGNDEYDLLYGGPGQREALMGVKYNSNNNNNNNNNTGGGLHRIQQAIRDGGMLYVGICAGAFLAANKHHYHSINRHYNKNTTHSDYDDGDDDVVLVPSVTLHDEENFGWASVRGWVSLDIPHSNQYKPILAAWWKRSVYYDDGPALVVTAETNNNDNNDDDDDDDDSDNNTQVLATYKSMVKIERDDQERVQKKYWSVASELVGKAAVTLTCCEKGKILLIGFHPECGGKATRKALTDLIAAVAMDVGCNVK